MKPVLGYDNVNLRNRIDFKNHLSLSKISHICYVKKLIGIINHLLAISINGALLVFPKTNNPRKTIVCSRLLPRPSTIFSLLLRTSDVLASIFSFLSLIAKVFLYPKVRDKTHKKVWRKSPLLKL